VEFKEWCDPEKKLRVAEHSVNNGNHLTAGSANSSAELLSKKSQPPVETPKTPKRFTYDEEEKKNYIYRYSSAEKSKSKSSKSRDEVESRHSERKKDREFLSYSENLQPPPRPHSDPPEKHFTRKTLGRVQENSVPKRKSSIMPRMNSQPMIDSKKNRKSLESMTFFSATLSKNKLIRQISVPTIGEKRVTKQENSNRFSPKISRARDRSPSPKLSRARSRSPKSARARSPSPRVVLTPPDKWERVGFTQSDQKLSEKRPSISRRTSEPELYPPKTSSPFKPKNLQPQHRAISSGTGLLLATQRKIREDKIVKRKV